jgi:hypothetical protein
VKEASMLLQHIFQLPFEQCLAKLITEEKTAKFLVDNLPLVKEAVKATKPTIVST